MHEVNIETIQNETLKIIKTSQELLTEIDSQNSAGGEEKTTGQSSIKNYTAMFRNEEKKLKTLDFVIAVVGTMKAGKSTTINAIVGQEVLPNRASPMTALPTLVTHKLGQQVPKLTVPKLLPLKALLQDVEKKLINDGKLSFEGGKALAETILAQKIEFKGQYSGREEIFDFLKTLNDLMRAAKDLNIEAPYESFSAVDELPRIEVEFYHLKHLEHIAEARLSILDTPGPNEFKHSERLQGVFKTQLHQASAIMLVMDYTIMNSKSDGDVRAQVKDIIDLIGKERIFVLVNKFDENGKNDPGYEETKNHVGNDLLDSHVPLDNIYPISSKVAFLVNRGLSEIAREGKIDADLPWVSDFGEMLFGKRWKKTIDDIEEVKEVCEAFWHEDSYFEKPLNNIIVHAHAKAAVGSIEATLNKLATMSKTLDNAFKVKEHAITENIEALKENIAALQHDISNMSKVSQSITDHIEKDLAELQDKLNKLTQKHLNSAQKEILGLFENQQAMIKAEKDAEKASEGNKRSGMFSLPSWYKRYDSNLEELIEEGEIEFRAREDAEKFTGEIQALVEGQVRLILSVSENDFKRQVQNFIPLINKRISDELGDVMAKVQERMGGNIEITIPEIEFTKDGIAIKGLLAGTIKEDTRLESIVTNKFFNFFSDDWGREYSRYTIFNVTKKSIDDNIIDVFKRVASSIRDNTENIYAKDIQRAIEQAILNLTDEIEGYRGEMLDVVKKRETKKLAEAEEIRLVKLSLEGTQEVMVRIATLRQVLNKLGDCDAE